VGDLGVDRRYGFRFAAPYRPAALVFGVTPRTASVVVGRGRLRVRFGPWLVQTPLSNVVSAAITGPYSFLKTAGPAHLSLADRGLTMATNGEAGVCIELAQPVTGIDPLGAIRHPALTVTVADCEGLVSALDER
jgi:hypothetical protein